jgi:hypothetical protein
MQRFLCTLLFCSIILSACSAVPSPPPPTPFPPTDTPIPISTTAAPDAEACGYQWATQELPELSSSFQQSIRALQPEAQANAYVFGENCIRSDGSIARFSAMETDFNVTLQVADPINEAELGEWIVKVMQVIAAIPPEQIVGPRLGRVSMVFQSGEEQKAFNFYIDQYQGLPPGLSNAEIFQALQISQ